MDSGKRAVFELREVNKAFASIVALANVSLRIEEGITTALLGPSGGGKSTLLRALLGLVQPDRGTVAFQGEALTPASARLLRRRMGYGVQGGGLFPHLTARENASLPAQVLGWPRERIAARLEALRELTQLSADALERYPGELSGGQAQRVSLMRALVLDPDVLLLDEPLAALDPDTRHDLQADLQRVFGQLRKTVVLVTHDLGEAYFLGQRWVLLREGRVIQEGAPGTLLRSPADDFVARFLRAQRNLPSELTA